MRLILTLLCALALTACATERSDFATEAEYQSAIEERVVKRELAVALALARIEAFNAQGLDPVQLDPTELLILDTACVVVLLAGIELDLDEQTILSLSAACTAIKRAAAPAIESEPI